MSEKPVGWAESPKEQARQFIALAARVGTGEVTDDKRIKDDLDISPESILQTLEMHGFLEIRSVAIHEVAKFTVGDLLKLVK